VEVARQAVDAPAVPGAERAATATRPTGPLTALTPQQALRLQRHAGNRAVGALLARTPRVAEDQHLTRNRFNVLPIGALTPIDGASPTFTYQENGHNSYRDEAGLLWELEPDWKTTYHQPPGHESTPHPYPNKKLLHRDASGGSSEAIRAPDGSYVTTGPLRGTYNFIHPSGAGGMVGHFARDVVPHELPGGDAYVDFPALDPRRVDVDTYRQRYDAQVHQVGDRSETNVTDPVDRTIVSETGVMWIQHPTAGEVLVVGRATNGRLTFVTFVDTEMRDLALARGEARQPRGVQRIPGAPPYIFGVPAAVPANTARR
jgi:hypothetical protein